jgi:hypothetical protein
MYPQWQRAGNSDVRALAAQSPSDVTRHGRTTYGNDGNLLDLIDIALDKQGRVEVGYADGCTGACASGGAQNFDALATIARQISGKTLFGAYDAILSGKHTTKKKR